MLKRKLLQDLPARLVTFMKMHDQELCTNNVEICMYVYTYVDVVHPHTSVRRQRDMSTYVEVE